MVESLEDGNNSNSRAADQDCLFYKWTLQKSTEKYMLKYNLSKLKQISHLSGKCH